MFYINTFALSICQAMPHAHPIIRRIPLPVSIRPAGRHVITDAQKLIAIQSPVAVIVEYGNYTAMSQSLPVYLVAQKDHMLSRLERKWTGNRHSP